LVNLYIDYIKDNNFCLAVIQNLAHKITLGQASTKGANLSFVGQYRWADGAPDKTQVGFCGAFSLLRFFGQAKK